MDLVVSLVECSVLFAILGSCRSSTPWTMGIAVGHLYLALRSSYGPKLLERSYLLEGTRANDFLVIIENSLNPYN